MAPLRRWADLPADLLCRIGDRLDLKWSFELTAIVLGSRCIGSSNGWIALSVVLFNGKTVFVLLNPIAAVEILLPPLIYESRWVSKVVFTPSPAKDDFAAAAICDIDRIAYVTAGARRWAVMDPVRLTCGDQLIDVVYTDKGKARPRDQDLTIPLRVTFCAETLIPYKKVPPESQGPHLNAPATVEPLLSEANLPFNPATVFAPPYDSGGATDFPETYNSTANFARERKLTWLLDFFNVGAPPEIVSRLSTLAVDVEMNSDDRQEHRRAADPELDRFMEIYCHMLVRYRQELTRPIQEADEFFRSMEAQIDAFLLLGLTLGSGVTLPARSILVVPLHLVQMDASVWGDDADQFNPHRFLKRDIDLGGLLTALTPNIEVPVYVKALSKTATSIIECVLRRDPHEAEYIQSIQEVVHSLEPVLVKNTQ
ncbi:hypothetical protein ZEAMMB73_Zm00001d030994 [Zea mays]|uniref:Uncharacterized protein n=1 Tax=Zea mays TaxID=4577 RepID=A0A1D6KFH9_MAIZE|nr:hypothetical protein ZEAMMB73_Zm00001d030994 [Zea mays]